jgi:hypothetical protein
VYCTSFKNTGRRLAGESGPNPTSCSKFIQLCAICNKAAECVFVRFDWSRSHRLLNAALERAIVGRYLLGHGSSSRRDFQRHFIVSFEDLNRTV